MIHSNDWMIQEGEPSPFTMGRDEPATKRQQMLLVRGGVLSPYSGLGGAFHDLRTSLESGSMPSWSLAEVAEYDLGTKPSAFKRLLKRWFIHPRTVKQRIKSLHAEGRLHLVQVSDQEQAHLLPRRCPVPVVIYVHDFFHLLPQQLELSGQTIEVGEQRPSPIRKRDLKRLMKGLHRTDGIICNTKATEALCREHFPSKPLFRIPYGLDARKYTPPEKLPAKPAALTTEQCHFLVVGSHDPRKRLAYLIDVLSRLDDALKASVHIHHIGGDTCPYSGQSAAAYAEQNNVQWTHVGSGIDDQTLNLYRWHTEALLFPSAAEGFGYPPVESMAAGQPVLASLRPAHEELLIEGQGLPAEDEQAWMAAIEAVHTTWTQRQGSPRSADPALMAHVEFLSPARFHKDMDEAWTTFCSS